MGLLGLTNLLAFGLGRLAFLTTPAEPLTFNYPEFSNQVSAAAAINTQAIGDSGKENSSNNQGQFVGSKNGTKYHAPWCSGAKQIKEENKIWFADAADATRAGYTRAANCPE